MYNHKNADKINVLTLNLRGDKDNVTVVKEDMEKERLENNRSFKGRSNEGRREGQSRKEGQPRREFSGKGDSSRTYQSGKGKGGERAAGKPGLKKDFQKGPRNNQFYDKDKDSDYEKKEVRKKPQSSSKDKVKEQQPDKMEVVKRLEKEKKAMQKKSQDKKKNQSARPQVRVKRTNNVDWTREYENDSFDDDDMYYF